MSGLLNKLREISELMQMMLPQQIHKRRACRGTVGAVNGLRPRMIARGNCIKHRAVIAVGLRRQGPQMQRDRLEVVCRRH